MHGLYAIVDLDSLNGQNLDPVAFAEHVLRAAPPFLQLRAKHESSREVLRLLRALRPLCNAAGTRLVSNDRPDLARLAAADGVHVGQGDLSVGEVRKLAPELFVGVSTHSFAELDAALDERPDYVAFGPVFPTRSKSNPDAVVGVEGLRRAKALCESRHARTPAGRPMPLVAIGGIDLERARAVAEVGAMAAVIGALVPHDGDLERVPALARALGEALEPER